MTYDRRGSDTGLIRVLIAAMALALSAVVLVVLLRLGGGASVEAVPGLPGPGATVWLLPAVQLLSRIAAVATIGYLLAAVVLSPRDGGRLSATAYRRIQVARWSATTSLLLGLLVLYLTFVDLIGVPVTNGFPAGAVLHFATAVQLGQALTASTVLAAIAAIAAVLAVTVRGAIIALLLGLAAVVPPIFTGHAAASGDHQIATSALLLHVLSATIWAGGLTALALSGRGPQQQLAVSVRRFSCIAGWCLGCLAVSGAVSAAVRLPSPGALFGTTYGQLIVFKTMMLGALAALGWQQRRMAMPALTQGNRWRFVVVAVSEVFIFAAAMGAAVALSRTPPPSTVDTEETVAQSLLGFAMPGPLTAGRLVTAWLPEPLFLALSLAAAGLYLWGVRRMHRRGDIWPVARTLLFLGACLVVIVATSSGVARYAPVLFSVHMGQHLLLNMIAPILLVLSGPVTLALRVLRPAADLAWPGPREWIQVALHSRLTHLLSQPLVALALYGVSLYLFYFTGLYEWSLRSHAAHLAMVAHFVLTGTLFFWVVIGIDPGPRRLAYPLRMLLTLAAMVFHAILGVVLMMSTTVLAADWFQQLARNWGSGTADDQYLGGGIAWSAGELPMAAVVIILVSQWYHADEREARRRDRAIDRDIAEGREDKELAAYNAVLAALAERDRAEAQRRAARSQSKR